MNELYSDISTSNGASDTFGIPEDYNLIIQNMNTSCNLTNTTETTPEFPRSFTVTATVVYAMIFALGLLGNVLVISVVCFNKNMKTSVNMYLLNLCVADILVLTICMPTALTDIYTRTAWHFGEAMCKYRVNYHTALYSKIKQNLRSQVAIYDLLTS